MVELKDAAQSSTFELWLASYAVDNDFSTVSCTGHVQSKAPWWSADLGQAMDVASVNITNDHHLIYGQLLLRVLCLEARLQTRVTFVETFSSLFFSGLW